MSFTKRRVQKPHNQFKEWLQLVKPLTQKKLLGSEQVIFGSFWRGLTQSISFNSLFILHKKIDSVRLSYFQSTFVDGSNSIQPLNNDCNNRKKKNLYNRKFCNQRPIAKAKIVIMELMKGQFQEQLKINWELDTTSKA